MKLAKKDSALHVKLGAKSAKREGPAIRVRTRGRSACQFVNGFVVCFYD